MTHIDDEGFGTAVWIMSGAKWWVVMKSRKPSDDKDFNGDLSSMNAFPLNFEVGHAGDGYFEAEAILLVAGDHL
jgi:hypothetical protein